MMASMARAAARGALNQVGYRPSVAKCLPSGNWSGANLRNPCETHWRSEATRGGVVSSGANPQRRAWRLLSY